MFKRWNFLVLKQLNILNPKNYKKKIKVMDYILMIIFNIFKILFISILK